METSVLQPGATNGLFSEKHIDSTYNQNVGSSNQSLQKQEVPPGHPRVPYVLQSLCGEIIYIPCSRSATRLLVTGKESDNAFAVVGSGGAQSAPIGFHYHNEAHDVFLCIKGQVNVWANNQARTMNPGDFASVPPKAIHQYQILGDHTEFLGLIVPGGWEEFFRFIGEPYAGPLFPLQDSRNPFEVLIPKLKAAAEQFDMVPCPRHPQFDPQPWQQTDNQLPGSAQPYFLRNNTGPAYLLGGTVCRPLATTAESAGRFTIASLEGSSHHSSGSTIFARHSSSSNGVVFETTHHCFQVSDGTADFVLNGSSRASLTVGETVYIPAGTTFRFAFASRFAKMYVFSNGAGLNELYPRLGEKYQGEVIPEQAVEWDVKSLEESQAEFGFKLV